MAFKKVEGIIFVVLMVLIAFNAGILGVLYAEKKFSPPVSQNVSLPKSKIFTIPREEGKNLPFHYLGQSVVGFALAQKSLYYQPKDIQARGVALTSDGWLAAPLKFFSQHHYQKYVAVTNQGIFPLKKIVRDNFLGIAFLQVSLKGKKLVPAQLASKDTLNPLTRLVSLDLFNDVASHEIINSNFLPNYLQSSEELQRRIAVSGKTKIGTPFFDQAGELVGLTVGESGDWSLLAPAAWWQQDFFQYLQQGKIVHVYFGIHYLSLAHFPHNGRSLAGALIMGTKKEPAVLPHSPADLAKLRAGDIILSIEGEDLGVDRTFAQMIQEYRPGVKVAITFLRNNKKYKKEVLLQPLTLKITNK